MAEVGSSLVGSPVGWGVGEASSVSFFWMAEAGSSLVGASVGWSAPCTFCLTELSSVTLLGWSPALGAGAALLGCEEMKGGTLSSSPWVASGWGWVMSVDFVFAASG